MSQCGSVIGYRKDGSTVELEAGIAKFYHNDAWILMVTMQDITKHKREEQLLLWQSTHDADGPTQSPSDP